jgi:hypothetical protein
MMETRLTKTDWIHRFSRTLMRLQPDLNAVTAAEKAVEAYRGLQSVDSQSVEPEVAAQSFAGRGGALAAARVRASASTPDRTQRITPPDKPIAD